MAKYIKQEMSDMLKNGGQKTFYRMKIERNIGIDEFISRMCHPGSGVTRGDAIGVLMRASDTLAELLAEGYSVSLDKWGTFKATIGLEKDKIMDTIDGDAPKHNARSLCVNGVNFQADKNLVWNISRRCKLERLGVSPLRRSPFTKEERLQKALDYLKAHKALRVKHYMELTGLSHTVAAKELRAFSCDKTSGIAAMGRGSTVVYIPNEVK